MRSIKSPPHVDRRDRSRAVRPEEPGPDPDDQPPAQVGRLDRRGELVRPLALTGLVVVAGQDRTIQQATHPGVGRRVDPWPQRGGDVGHRHLERRLGRERLGVKGLGPVQRRPDPQRLDQRVQPLGAARRLRSLTQLARLGDEQRAHLPHEHVFRRELDQLAQDPAAAAIHAET